MKQKANPLSILIVGVHSSVCCGLEALLGTSSIVGEVHVASYSTAQDISENGVTPDVVLVDETAEGDDHNATVSTLRELFPKSHIIVLTLAWSASSEGKEFRVLSKSAGTEELMRVIQKVATKSTLT